jgi:sugar phosphate isomerase/epimerase
MTRRSLLLTAAGTALGQVIPQASEMSVEGYIFQQYASRLKKPLGDVVSEVIPMARQAGFRNLELNDAFFAPESRERTVSLLRAQGLSMPSVYVGGALHDKDLAKKTIERVLATCDICKPFGCQAVVNNPDPKPNGAPKTDAELAVEADSINALNRTLADRAFQLRIHHHTPQLENHAREWRFLLRHTDAHLCVDVDWAYEGGFDPVEFLSEAGKRVAELHVRSARNKLWLEDVEDSDIDYGKVAAYLKRERMHPLIVVELAYRPETKVTRGLEEDLEISRKYTERVFGIG